MKYLTIEDILIIAVGHVRNYQLLRENQLHYLIEAVGGRFGDTDLFPTVFQKAAVYAHHIITGHIFFDGNKRIGLTCALQFLELNGYFRHADIEDSIIDLGFKIADGSITDIDAIAEQIQSWIL